MQAEIPFDTQNKDPEQRLQGVLASLGAPEYPPVVTPTAVAFSDRTPASDIMAHDLDTAQAQRERAIATEDPYRSALAAGIDGLRKRGFSTRQLTQEGVLQAIFDAVKQEAETDILAQDSPRSTDTSVFS